MIFELLSYPYYVQNRSNFRYLYYKLEVVNIFPPLFLTVEAKVVKIEF